MSSPDEPRHDTDLRGWREQTVPRSFDYYGLFRVRSSVVSKTEIRSWFCLKGGVGSLTLPSEPRIMGQARTRYVLDSFTMNGLVYVV